MHKFSLFSLIILTGLLLALSTPSSAASNSSSSPGSIGLLDTTHMPFAPGVVLVGFKSNTAPDITSSGLQSGNTEVGRLLAGLNVKTIEPVFPGGTGPVSASDAAGGSTALDHIYRLRLPANGDVLNAVAALQANPEVAYAEPDYLAHALVVPNDPLYAQQWALSKINAPEAWNTTTGSTDVVVAVVDAGLDASHPDLAGQVWTNPGEIAGNGIDDDYNGKVDDINGWNIIGNNADLSDNTGHGSQVAGVIAAKGNNGQGIAGVCWQCRLMVVKVMQPGGLANYSDIAAGIAYAAQKGADIINLSLGGSADSATLRAAIAAAAETAAIVGGAGNDNSSAPFYPAAYDEYVLAVAGTGSGDVKVATSNFGPWVDVTAPGEDITTTLNGGGYGPASGTSVAAPFASGLAGLLLSQHSDWSAAQVRAHIRQTANNIDAVNPGYAGQLGSGRIEAQLAVVTPPQPLLRQTHYEANGQIDDPIKTGVPVALAVSLQNNWGDAANVVATLSSPDPLVSISQATAAYGPIPALQIAINSSQPFQISVAAGAYGRLIPFNLQVTADGVASTLVFTATSESEALSVAGLISTDTIWTNDRVYHVTGNTVVNPGVTLTIQPGTQVKFDEVRMLAIRGTLIAAGSPAQPIRFTAWTLPDYINCQPAMMCPGEWGGSYQGSVKGGLVFTSDSPPAQFDGDGDYVSGSIIQHAIVEYSFGGIQTGPAAPFVDHNLIRHNRDTAIGCGSCSDQLRISHNRIINNNTGYILNLVSGQAQVRQNLIAHNQGAIRSSGGHTIISNTITANTGVWCHSAAGALCLEGPALSMPVVRGNNIYANQAPYEVVMGTLAGFIGDVDAPANYWGTADPAEIQARTYDFTEDSNAGVFTFTPFLVEPNPDAPPILYQLSLDPPSPVGIQRVTFNLTFSRPMDQSLNPTVTFGATAPYSSYAVVNEAQWTGDRTWRASYDITSLVARGIYIISVSQARDLAGFEIPADTRFGFTVDYAGQITDQTPPPPPAVIAGGRAGDPSTVEGLWLASDPESAITAYRYAIGSAPGAVDIINWNATASTTLTKSGLGLVEGRQYWLSVQAQNAGGLWSASGYGSFVAGQPMGRVFLPTVIKGQ